MNHVFPASWRPDWAVVLPSDPLTFHGPLLAQWLTIAFLLLVTARSLVHLLAPDGGAHSIATIDTSVRGGANIVGVFGQWGAIQLLLAGLLSVLFLCYRGLVPLILCVLLLEPFLRGLSGRLKPIETRATAPGAALNWIAIPVVALALYLSVCPAKSGAYGWSSREVFAFLGIGDHAETADGPLGSFTLLTSAPGPDQAHHHNQPNSDVPSWRRQALQIADAANTEPPAR
jgi:hypothetical protein